jgi:nucleoside phosphorylase
MRYDSTMVYITYAYKPEIAALVDLTGDTGGRIKYICARGARAGDILAAALGTVPAAPTVSGTDIIINAGFAGSLASDLTPGDVVIVKEFAARSVIGGAPTEWPPLRDITGIRKVSCLTVPAPIAAADERDELRLATGADIVDMEVFHLQAAARRLNIPFLSFKVISDTADTDAYASAVGQTAKWAKILGEVVNDFLSGLDGGD